MISKKGCFYCIFVIKYKVFLVKIKTMKIKLYSFLAFVGLVSTGVLSSCTQEKKQLNSNENKEEMTETTIVSDSYQKKTINKELMLKLDSTYTANNYRYINEKRPKSKPDSREFWYTLEELEGYIAYAKKEAESKGQKVTGIKIKMGQYPEKGDFDSRLDSKLYGYQTVYLIPTVISADQEKATNTESEMKGAEIEGIPGMDLSSANPPY